MALNLDAVERARHHASKGRAIRPLPLWRPVLAMADVQLGQIHGVFLGDTLRHTANDANSRVRTTRPALR